MKVVDANVLLYAVNEDDPHHDEARGWLDRALSSHDVVGFTWLVLLAFLRLSTKEGVFPRPLHVDAAVATVRAWLSRPSSVVLEPTSRHLDVLGGMVIESGTGGNLTSDAHLAAIAVEHGASVATYDSDLGRFRGVAVERPSREQ